MSARREASPGLSLEPPRADAHARKALAPRRPIRARDARDFAPKSHRMRARAIRGVRSPPPARLHVRLFIDHGIAERRRRCKGTESRPRATWQRATTPPPRPLSPADARDGLAVAAPRVLEQRLEVVEGPHERRRRRRREVAVPHLENRRRREEGRRGGPSLSAFRARGGVARRRARHPIAVRACAHLARARLRRVLVARDVARERAPERERVPGEGERA